MKDAKTFKFRYLLQGWWLLFIAAGIIWLPSMAYADTGVYFMCMH